MPLKGEVGGHALNSHGNYIVDHGKSHAFVFLNFCGNPDTLPIYVKLNIPFIKNVLPWDVPISPTPFPSTFCLLYTSGGKVTHFINFCTDWTERQHRFKSNCS